MPTVVDSPVQIAYNTQAKLGECPRWDEQNNLLYWVDIDGNSLHKFNPRTHINETVVFEEKIGCFSLSGNGGFVVGMQSGFGLLDGFHNRVQYTCDPESHIFTNRFNDGRCDAFGRFVSGTVNMEKTTPNAGIYQIAPHTVHMPKQLVYGLLTANGIAFSNDAKTLYYSDTPNHVIYTADYDIDTGTIGIPTVFQKFKVGKGRPDGAAVDSQGYYWVAMYNGAEILRISPTGTIVERVAIPSKHCTMLAFGGADLKTVFVTTASGNMTEAERKKYPYAGSIFSFRTTVAGNIEHRFMGQVHANNQYISEFAK